MVREFISFLTFCHGDFFGPDSDLKLEDIASCFLFGFWSKIQTICTNRLSSIDLVLDYPSII